MKKLIAWLHVHKYELLLVSLIQHLFIGVFLEDFDFYFTIVWPINILVVGMASIGIFVKKGRWKQFIRTVLFIVVLGFPIAWAYLGVKPPPRFMLSLNIAYVIFFSYIFREIIMFLIRPGYINKDLISASACGYFLLLEITVFLLQLFAYEDAPNAFNGLDYSSPSAVFMDLVYFNSITLTSIGFGDITPKAHYAKLLTAFIGIVGQFYSVVLVGILISKFSAKTTFVDEHEEETPTPDSP